MTTRSIFLSTLLFGFALFGASCKAPTSSVEAVAREKGRAAAEVPSAAAKASPPTPPRFALHSPYPAGAWRLHKGELEHVVVWASHLLIRYADVKVSDSVSFSMAAFRTVLPPATRTRDEALALAVGLSQRAREHPEHFAELVREYSEDLVRRDSGGSLGGIPAAQLTPWPEVLDALSSLRPGQISDPVETWYGFHVLMRRAPPAEDTVTGRRIVIGHSEARFLAVANGVAPTRSRTDALALANRIHAQAKANPARFLELVLQRSEHRDRARGGDFGTWSNREPAPFPREIEVLTGLEVGEVSAPFDSLFGIQVVQRIENRPRPTYAIDGVRLPFDPNAADTDPRSPESALAQALQYHRQLLDGPQRLLDLQARQQRYDAQWLDGRGSPELTAALAAVAPGELLREPVRSASSYIIGRRREPISRPSPKPSFELP